MKTINKIIVFTFSFSLLVISSFSQTADSTFTNIDQAVLAPLQVKILDLSNQGLKSLPEDISKFENLNSIVLSGNPDLDLKIIARNLSSCKKLKTLYLENNKLKTLPSEIGDLKSLEGIYLLNNRISSVPREMKYLNLKFLDLGNNYINEDNIIKIFQIVPNTTTINISNSKPGEESRSLKYYQEGNKAANIGQLLLADSLYTLSINLEPNHDTYFNRAIVRRKLKDINGYCLDLGSSSSLNDNEANHLYWRDCGTIDSAFLDKEGMRVKKGEHAFCEITSKSKYTTYMRFKRIDIHNKILVHFEVINDDTIFYATPTPPVYSEKEENLIMVLTNNVTPTSSEKQNINKTIVVVTFNILKNGDVDGVTAFSSFGKNYNDRLIEIFKKHVKKWEPAKYNNKPVRYRRSIQYYITP